MFIPLRDDNSLKSIPFQYVTVGLIASTCSFSRLEVGGLSEAAVASFGVTPRELLGSEFLARPESASRRWSRQRRAHDALLTYMFFHADVVHLVGNMLFLWVFGDNVEDAMGHARFLIFYLACGVFAGLFHAFVPGSDCRSSAPAARLPASSPRI